MPAADLHALALQHLMQALADPVQLVALVSAAMAGALVIVSAFVRTMIPLRWLAVGSNLGFIVYGIVHPNLLMLALHAVLLPVRDGKHIGGAANARPELTRLRESFFNQVAGPAGLKRNGAKRVLPPG
jgi:hypothetical protein